MGTTNAFIKFTLCLWISIILSCGFFIGAPFGANGTNINISDMAVDVWGQLAKAQDDATTIDEAVATAIAEHEADADSHLGAGESLQSHRAEEIIDHVIGSVLADKMSYTEGIFESVLTNLDQWATTGTVSVEGFGTVNIYADGVPDSHSQMYASAPFGPASLTLTTEYMFQTVLDVYYDDDTDFLIGVGAVGATPQNHSIGFYFDGTDWKAFYRNGSTTYYSYALTINNEQQYVLRVHNSASEKTLRWYVNGTEVWEYVYTDNTEVMGTFIVYDVTRTAGEAYMNVNKVMVSKSCL